MAKKKQQSTIIADVPVQFGGVSIGQHTAKLSFKITRESLTLESADELFCERRLTGKIQLGGQEDSPQQGKLFNCDVSIDGSFDIHRFGVTSDAYTTGATLKLKEIDIALLAKFSKGAGRIIVLEAQEIPEDAPAEKHEDGQMSLPGTYENAGPWRKASLASLFSGALLKSLTEAGLLTVGDLHDYQQPSSSGYEKRLTDIPGIGPSKVEIIENKMLEFWRDNPQHDQAELQAIHDGKPQIGGVGPNGEIYRC